MTARTSYKTEICTHENCNKIISAGTRFAVQKVPSKNILFEPTDKNIFSEKIICLSHVYKKAEQKRIKQFSLFEVK